MKIGKKIILLPLLILFFSISYKVFAGDCDYVDSMGKKKIPVKYSIIFSNDAFNRAVDNLKAYCCDKYPENITTCGSLDKVDDYPQSEYLYDHLIDVAFRNLDGYEGKYNYGLNGDVLGVERRNFITGSSESITGDIAAKILKEYDKYRKLKRYKYNDDFLLDYNNIDKVSLADKYYFTCDIVRDIIDNVFVGREKSNDIYYDKCKSLAYGRMQNENTYVRTVIISSSNQLLKSTFDAYAMTYFVKEKLSALKQKLVEFVNVFYTIYKQAPVGKSCSK